MFIFCEWSVYAAIWWVAFENNTPGTRARVKAQLDAFLLRLHNQGYFAGTTPDESFQVICDTSNNPPESVNAGELIVDVAIAPGKPAEFIILRFKQKINT